MNKMTRYELMLLDKRISKADGTDGELDHKEKDDSMFAEVSTKQTICRAATTTGLMVLLGFGGVPTNAFAGSELGSTMTSNMVKTVRSFSGVEANSDHARLQVKEVLLGRVPKDMQLDSVPRNLDQASYWRAVESIGLRWLERFAVSPDQRRVAIIEKQDGKSVAVINGEPERAYDEISEPGFSPDSRRFAYSARRGTDRFMVVDGVEGRSYDPGSEMYPIFSPDSQSVAFMTRRAGSVFMVINSTESKPYASFRTTTPPTVFSPNSKRFAYAAETHDKKWVMVIDGTESHPHDEVGSPLFSPDSQHVLYQARRGDSSFVVVDGVEGQSFERVERAIFSPNSKRVAYLVGHKQGAAVVTDGKLGLQYDLVEMGSLVFSPDSQRLAYAAKTGLAAFVVAEGKEGSHYDGIEEMPLFSPDGKHLAYAASRQGKTFMVLDGVEGPHYIDITHPVFSLDSKHLAYAAAHGLTATVLCDGKQGPKHALGDIVGSRSEIVFSPSSQRMAYRISVGGKAVRFVVDGKESKLYENVRPGSVTFSPDSQHVAYWASPFSGEWYIVVDGSTTVKYTRVLENTLPVFDEIDSLHALAVRGDEIFLLQLKIPLPASPEVK
jgi:hypothetical protein